MILKIYKKYF
jgi:hypothetical protein